MATLDDLTNSTTALLNAVNVSKATLDEKVSVATNQAAIATTQAEISTTQAEIAAAKATTATDAVALAFPGGVNNIGIPGAAGFGVGICPTPPIGFTPLPGYTDPLSVNYGNYMFSDGSVMCWVPKFWYKIGTGANGLAVNMVDVKGLMNYTSTAAANADGYALHRAFIDGGIEKTGFFVDKYKCSKNAWGTGFIASSIANGLPISTAASHNPIGELTAVAGINAYYAAITAAKARDGVNGAVNAASMFFCSTRFITAGLALLSLAHGQASSAATYCAWYMVGANFPKGCNNNALKDTNDTTVTYLSDGFSNCGKTGSGVPFAKTTHNGQSCGVADVNGLMYEINPGLTCINGTKAITGITQANPAVVTAVAHGRTNGEQVSISGIVGMTQAHGIATVANATADTFELAGVNSTAFTAYVSGGTISYGVFYVLKTTASVKALTAGNTLVGDLWGATGAAANYDAIAVPFANGANEQAFGNGANQVLSEAVSGDAWKLAGLGLPKEAAGISPAGSSLFGTDYYSQYFTNDMVPLSCYSWDRGMVVGVWSAHLGPSSASTDYRVGFRSACYLVG